MVFKTQFGFIGLLFMFLAQSVMAANVYTCPDISEAAKIGACSSESELKLMFRTTCGWQDYEKDNPHAAGVCMNYKIFKKAKNTAYWESKDTRFDGYISCDKKDSDIKASKLVSISLGQKRQMNRVICGYEGGYELVLRTKENCEIPNAKVLGRYLGRECTSGDTDCKATCN